VAGDHPIELVVAGQGEAQTDTEALEQRLSGSKTPQTGHRRPHAVQSMVVLVGLQGDVITEPLGLLVSVGVTTHVREQRRVIDDRSLVLVETEVLGETRRDPALAQYVLHRLAEAQVDTERQRTDELRQANAFEIGRLLHPGARLTTPPRGGHW